MPNTTKSVASRGRKTRIGSWLAMAASAAVIANAPLTAMADDYCPILQTAGLEVNRDIARLLADYPGTNLVIGMCGALAEDVQRQSVSDQAAGVRAFLGCAVIGCAMVGFDSCMDVTKEWFVLAARQSKIDEYRKTYRCAR